MENWHLLRAGTLVSAWQPGFRSQPHSLKIHELGQLTILCVCFRFLIYKMDGQIILVYHPLTDNLVYQWIDNVMYLPYRFLVKMNQSSMVQCLTQNAMQAADTHIKSSQLWHCYGPKTDLNGHSMSHVNPKKYTIFHSFNKCLCSVCFMPGTGETLTFKRQYPTIHTI